MNGKWAWGFAIAVATPLLAGCASNAPGVVRAQSPTNESSRYVQQSNYQTEAGASVDIAAGGTCPECGGYGGCHAGGCGHGRHHLWFHYKHPQHLDYPTPSPSPAAVVQYPYYTHKGPDDFFFQH